MEARGVSRMEWQYSAGYFGFFDAADRIGQCSCPIKDPKAGGADTRGSAAGFRSTLSPREAHLSDLTPQLPPELPAEPDPTHFTLGGYTGPSRVIEGVSFWPRVGARMIDIAVMTFLGFIAGAIFGVVLAVVATVLGQPPAVVAARYHRSGIAVFIFSLLAGVAYHTICEGLHGSTAGKLALQMVVVGENGTPCDLEAALKREIAYFFDALFFGLIGYVSMKKSPQEQRYGDHWAHTIVCNRAAVAPQYLRGGNRFTGVLALASLANIALVIVGLLLT
jgi:uncharacterized RDD family membrane protein YckC